MNGAPGMTAFVFATPREAQPFIRGAAAVRVQETPYSLYRARLAGLGQRPVLIAVTGMGMVAAAAVMHLLLGRYPLARVINCGVAGSLRPDLAVGEILDIRSSLLLDAGSRPDVAWQRFARLPELSGLAEADLVTLAEPLFDPRSKAQLAAVADLVDMEGGVVARLCRTRGVDCQLLKVVSDFAEDRQQLHRNLDQVSQLLAARLLQAFRGPAIEKVSA